MVDVDDEEEKAKKTKKVKQVTKSWDHLNEQRPLWMRKPEDVSEEEYGSFYKAREATLTDLPYSQHMLIGVRGRFSDLLGLLLTIY